MPYLPIIAFAILSAVAASAGYGDSVMRRSLRTRSLTTVRSGVLCWVVEIDRVDLLLASIFRPPCKLKAQIGGSTTLLAKDILIQLDDVKRSNVGEGSHGVKRQSKLCMWLAGRHPDRWRHEGLHDHLLFPVSLRELP